MNKKIFLILIVIIACVGLIRALLFITTTIRSEPEALHLALPKETDKDFARPTGPVINLLLYKNDHVFYYNDSLTGNGRTVSMEELGTILEARKKSSDSALFTVVIKPAKDATYKSIVDMLDQMLIHNIRKYATVDITDSEQELVKNIQ